MRTHLLRVLLVLAAGIAAFHLAAIAFSLYWTFVWLDVAIHFAGGAFIALFALWVVFFAGPLARPHLFSPRRALYVAAIAIAVVGIGWEVFEVTAGIPIEDNYVFDTTVDLIMDVFGAGVAAWYVIRNVDYV